MPSNYLLCRFFFEYFYFSGEWGQMCIRISKNMHIIFLHQHCLRSEIKLQGSQSYIHLTDLGTHYYFHQRNSQYSPKYNQNQSRHNQCLAQLKHCPQGVEDHHAPLQRKNHRIKYGAYRFSQTRESIRICRIVNLKHSTSNESGHRLLSLAQEDLGVS